ncbi:unnamed protein product [Triticum turgidum subsp. durum]|uniref:Uncharacterized protein n=1 Tax=Triticum turgidum subsp. durum TaxID=4567 RepID=A0A9R1NT20_TRITD|nr:unnamed protein product [Triticum turgidum subsp. durum]
MELTGPLALGRGQNGGSGQAEVELGADESWDSGEALGGRRTDPGGLDDEEPVPGTRSAGRLNEQHRVAALELVAATVMSGRPHAQGRRCGAPDPKRGNGRRLDSSRLIGSCRRRGKTEVEEA